MNQPQIARKQNNSQWEKQYRAWRKAQSSTIPPPATQEPNDEAVQKNVKDIQQLRSNQSEEDRKDLQLRTEQSEAEKKYVLWRAEWSEKEKMKNDALAALKKDIEDLQLRMTQYEAETKDLQLRAEQSEAEKIYFQLRAEQSVIEKEKEKKEMAYSEGNFKTVQEVWRTTLTAYCNAKNSLFRNNSSFLWQQLKKYIAGEATESMFSCYFSTVQGGNDSSNDLADKSSRDGSVKSNDNNHNVDIFGKFFAGESAHLMPHAGDCAKFWYPLVSWVLPIFDDNGTMHDDKKYLQTCIHGFKGLTGKKEDIVGIKHFSTNRIRMLNQKALDEDHRVLIVPLLTADAVCNWNGKSYDAIVLVNDQPSSYSSEQVYVQIGAGTINRKQNVTWADCLATWSDLETAQLLLHEAVLSFSNSVAAGVDASSGFIELPGSIAATENTIVPPLIESPGPLVATEDTIVTRHSDQILESWSSAVKSLIDFKAVVVPSAVNSNIKRAEDLLNVRKISFTTAGNGHLPPDPGLLLMKTVSNWLYQNKIDALPVCDIIENNDNDSEDYYSSVISTNDEVGSVCHVFPVCELECKTSDETFSDFDGECMPTSLDFLD